MHFIPSTRRPGLFHALRAALLLAAVGTFGACDRHSAEEAPESYGHGSSHQRTVPDHQIDSRSGSKSFSDTVGTHEEQAEENHATREGTPTPTPSGRFY